MTDETLRAAVNRHALPPDRVIADGALSFHVCPEHGIMLRVQLIRPLPADLAAELRKVGDVSKVLAVTNLPNAEVTIHEDHGELFAAFEVVIGYWRDWAEMLTDPRPLPACLAAAGMVRVSGEMFCPADSRMAQASPMVH